jgi:hypothetical protein
MQMDMKKAVLQIKVSSKGIKPLILFLFLFLAGYAGATTHEYVWSEYPIAPERVSTQIVFTEGQELWIAAGKSGKARIILGAIGANEYFGSRQLLADAIVVQLTGEMRNKGLRIVDTAGKSLEIRVDRTDYEMGLVKFAATIEFTVKFGNGTTKSYVVRNSTPGPVERAYNGAVALAVIRIMNDAEVFNYINKE